MKKVFWISGIIAVLLLSLILTGMVNADDSVNIALRRGNIQFSSGEYENALRAFEVGLEASAENYALNFSAGLSAYMLGEFEKAIEYFEKSEDSIEKFLNSGNASFRLGESSTDENEQLQRYTQAMETYHSGIIRFPQNIQLKYNYEVVKEIVNEFLNDMNQDSQEQDNQEQDNQEQNDSNDGQSSDQEDHEGTEQEQEQSESIQQDQEEGSEESQALDPEQEEAAGQEQNEEENEQQEEGLQENSTSEEGDELDRETTERILRILEGMESESLKNNQEVITGVEGNYAW